MFLHNIFVEKEKYHELRIFLLKVQSSYILGRDISAKVPFFVSIASVTAGNKELNFL